MKQSDVLIVGAGPTGLVLALWLQAQGVGVRIIDKAGGPGTTSRAMVIHARTLELYRQMGMADAVVAAGHPSRVVNMWARGKRRARIDMRDFGGDITPYPYLLIFPQDQHEAFLCDQIARRGLTIERNTELLEAEDTGDQVTATLRGPDGTTEVCTARFMVGADGAASTVRKGLGGSFDGGTYQALLYVADVEVAQDTFNGNVHLSFDETDFLLVFPYGTEGKMRLVGSVRSERVAQSGELNFEDVGHESLHAMGITVTHLNWFSTYKSHHRMTDRFRQGNIFLAGDAAHIHSPAGGQGMNTGIGDAVNLAWKLAAVVNGRGNQALLDSYHDERAAFARTLIRTTDQAFNLASRKGSLFGFMRTYVVPNVAKLAFGLASARAAMFRAISQVAISYSDGPLGTGTAGSVSGGDRLPFVHLDGGDNYGPLADITWQVHVYGQPSGALRSWCADRDIPLHVFAWGKGCEAAGLMRDAAYLLRPDTYVGCAVPKGDVEPLQAYLTHLGV
ncbi:FAD-dependent monooxygenase [Pseudosulfitobacter sp. DSM 107133]|jgi:2-polyprenyl-6-methoxyphenol hydroxylase-like FAD-dependent oxidoreductase|uniref:FAD-dependent monooxygenase n=1 Tax=Pseudosulfitobacter sp. DSM 107133 TaxID=2883100 RepID=UPI000DF16B79|nr:FAD-dependent monooxygenase [Pseudosulfitobacter sp. DSM 107133]UOA25421.1 6-methylpretetramide 4-monooxygenase [Pseudosulfitobacter sp. DSM 107133]